MTGFGKAAGTSGGKKITVEIRTLNSKQLDLNIRMPSSLREKEGDIRKICQDKLIRGKADLSVFVESGVGRAKDIINRKLVIVYLKELKAIARENKQDDDELLEIAMRMPDVFKAEVGSLDKNEWKTVSSLLQKALVQVDAFRVKEGKALAADLKAQVGKISANLEKITAMEAGRMQSVRDRIGKFLAESGVQVDSGKFEQELIFYLEKLDINEEKVRLKNHCVYFLEAMKEDQCGRKLGFIAQEIGREINTIGSKANHSEMQKRVVEMKDDLEKIKEQVNNIL